MAKLDLDDNPSAYQIRAYKPGCIQVNEERLTDSLIITPHALIKHWQPQTAAELSVESFSPIIPLKPTILLIGMGSQFVFLNIEIYGQLINLGIGVEVMDTHAACRTFNALSSENRQVAAALLIR